MENLLTYDWSRFVKRVTINAPTQDIYDAWATRKGLENWFLRIAEFKSPEGRVLADNEAATTNDSYVWYWHGWDDTVLERGKVLGANGKDSFSFEFGDEGIVSVHIFQEEGINIVELIQEKILTDEEYKVRYHLGCSTGWTFYLSNLKSILEGGIDLRNRNLNIKNVVNS
ncbi:MAG: SRPBCC domain-containing protein [Sphingobacteriales bacterium]|nr:MAG: SRPBCC domain-containing protein [Sphingobacteriales bacterium]